jgi:hypothetical protein
MLVNTLVSSGMSNINYRYNSLLSLKLSICDRLYKQLRPMLWVWQLKVKSLRFSCDRKFQSNIDESF